MPIHSNGVVPVALALALGVAGCSPERRPQPSTSVRDLTRLDSGVLIGPEALRAASVGEGNGIDDFRGALSTPSGEIAVADAGLHQVVLFDRAGALIARTGRQGAGPGEFNDIALVAFWGESLAVFDGAQRRLSFLRRDGTVVRQRAIDLSGVVVPTIIGFREDGAPLLKGIVLAPPPGSGATFPIRGLVVAIGNERRDTVAAYDEGLWHQRGPRWYSWRATATPADSGIWVGAGGRPEVEFVSWNGETRATLRWSASTRAVTEADKAKIVAIAEGRRAAPGLTSDDRFADSIPYFGRVLSDPLGGLWVVASAALYEAPDSVWRIDERALTIQGLKLPAGFRPTQVGRDFLLGVLAGDDGSLQVVRYPLRRGSSAAGATESAPPASMP